MKSLKQLVISIYVILFGQVVLAENLTISSDTVSFDPIENTQTYSGKVQLVVLNTDALTFEADEVSDIEGKIHANGTVKIIRDGHVFITTDSVVITNENEKMIFSMEKATHYMSKSL